MRRFGSSAGLPRGAPPSAQRAIRSISASVGRGVVASSGQALAWNLAAKADAQIAQGRFAEAIETAASGRTLSGESELPQQRVVVLP